MIKRLHIRDISGNSVHFYDHLCACGCGNLLEIKKEHRIKSCRLSRYSKGHRSKKIIELPDVLPMCACGCGVRFQMKEIYKSSGLPKYIKNHDKRKLKELRYCECGCRERIEHFAEYGYQTLIIWENKLQEVEVLKEKLLGAQKNEKS